MNNRLRFERLGFGIRRSDHSELSRAALHFNCFYLGAHIDSEGARAFHQSGDQIGIEVLQWALALMQNCDARTRSGGHMREFKRDIATADEDQTSWQLVEFKKLIATRQVFLAGDIEFGWPRT